MASSGLFGILCYSFASCLVFRGLLRNVHDSFMGTPKTCSFACSPQPQLCVLLISPTYYLLDRHLENRILILSALVNMRMTLLFLLDFWFCWDLLFFVRKLFLDAKSLVVFFLLLLIC